MGESFAEASRWAAHHPGVADPSVAAAPQQAASVQDSRPSWAVLPGELGAKRFSLSGDSLPQAGKLPGDSTESAQPHMNRVEHEAWGEIMC